MKPITFFDMEIDPGSERIVDIGGIKADGRSFHSGSVANCEFLQGTRYIAYNILNHDLKYIRMLSPSKLRLSILHLVSLSLYSGQAYHALLKDDRCRQMILIILNDQ